MPLYDADFIYIGIRAFDSQPTRIIATQRQRDSSLDGDDSVALAFDTFLDLRHGYYFQVNPLGARRDGLISPDTNLNADTANYQPDWDGIWYAAAVIDAQGWTAEIAIPMKTLTFDPLSPTWGFNIQRTIARKNEIVRWAGAQRQKQVSTVDDAGRLEGLSGLRQGLGLDFVPYVKLQGTHDSRKNRNDVELKPGFDLFYKITPSVTVALTVNTDFAEVEVDERRVNLTRFPLFFEEKRAFFLQDANGFRFGGIQTSPLPFFSRRIGLSPAGAPIDLLGGLKTTGRLGRVSFGLLNVQTEATRVLASKNLTVGRATFDVMDESAVGVIFTNGDPFRRGENRLGGVDWQYKNSHLWGGNQVLEAATYFMRSDTNGRMGNAFGGRLLYPNFAWEGAFIFDQIDNDFDPALGFLDQPGARTYEVWGERRWNPPGVDSFGVQFYGFARTTLNNEVLESSLWLPRLALETQERDRIEFAPILAREQFFEPFALVPEVVIPAGDYTRWQYHAQLITAKTRLVSGLLHVDWGGYVANGTRTSIDVQVTWRPHSLLNLDAEYTQTRIHLPGQKVTVHIAQSTLTLALTPNLIWNLTNQYDNVSDEFGVNSRLRWTITPGRDLFLVFNYGADTSAGRWRPLLSQASCKVAWTFRF